MAEAVVKLGDGNWATKEGKLLAHKQVGDKYLNTEFTVTRGTDATYVGRDGLIKQMSDASTELVQNGDFSATGSELVVNGDFSSATSWNVNSNWNINTVSGVAEADGTSNADINQSVWLPVIGKSYKVTFEVVSLTRGRVLFKMGSVNGEGHTTIGIKTEYIVATSTDRIRIDSEDSFIGSVKDVSVEELGEDWASMDGAIDSYNENGLTITSINTDQYNRLRQNSITEDGKSYKVTYTIQATSFSAGTVIQYYDGDTYNALPKQGVGTHTFYYTRDADNDAWYFNLDASASASTTDYVTISSISVKQISDIVGDIPRIDFLNNPEGHLLLEPASTNLIPYSEKLTQFTASNTTVTDNITTSPKGTQGASRVTKEGNDGNDRIKVNSVSVSDSTVYSISVFVKNDDLVNGGRTTVGFRTSGTLFRRAYDWSDNSLAYSSSHNSGTRTSEILEDYGNGWYRIGFSFTTDATTGSFEVDIDRVNESATTSVFVWGAQFVESAYPTSYIPTHGVAVTRATETCNSAGVAADFDSVSGVVYADIAALTSDSGSFELFSLSPADTSTTHRIFWGFNNDADEMRGFHTNNSGNDINLTYSTALDITNFNKMAFKYKATEFALWINGVERSVDSRDEALTAGTMTELNANSGGTGSPFYGKIKSLRVYKEALSDAELELITS